MTVATIGDTVRLWSNKNTGIIKFVGQIDGKTGTYYGIELDKPAGENNGSLNNKCYFNSNENHGLFLKRDTFKISKRNSNVLRITVGNIVTITKIKCKGIIRFIGNTLFKPDIIWYGIQLEDPKGKNNGCIDGVQYFQCQNNYGLFVQSNRIETTANTAKKQVKKRTKIQSNSNSIINSNSIYIDVTLNNYGKFVLSNGQKIQSNKKQNLQNVRSKYLHTNCFVTKRSTQIQIKNGRKIICHKKRKKFVIQISKPQKFEHLSKINAQTYPISHCFDRIKLLISGYESRYYIPNEIKEIIIKYYFFNKYIWIETSKSAKKYTYRKSWIRSETKLLFPNQAQFQFDEKCPVNKCETKNHLTFIASYTRPKKLMKYCEVNTVVEINEYHCFECSHYIRHNLVQHVHKGEVWGVKTGARLNRWYSLEIKPAPHISIHNNVFLEKNGECFECKKRTLLMNIYREKNVELRVRYCDECHLIHRDRYKNPDVDDSPYSKGNNWGLPKGWVVHASRSKRGRLYFTNQETGISQWKDPRPLPYGFTSSISCKQKRGRVYYVNKYDKKTTWKDPRPAIEL
eukprot:288779_1